MAATLSTTYALCFVIVLLITRLVWKALKPLPAGCGAAPKYTSSLWWDILNLGHLLDLLQAAHSGTLHEVETSYARALSEIKGYKVRTYSYNRAGLSAITTSDVANVSAVLASQFSDFIVGGRQKAFAPLLGNPTMLAMDGEAWKHARSALRPIFARERVHDLYIMRKHNTGLLNTLLEARRDTVAAVDLQSMFVEHSLHISMELFGVGCIGDEYNAFHAALGESSAMLMKRSMTGKLYWLADSIAFRRACRTCLDLVDKQAKPVWLQSQRSSVPDEKPQDIGGKQTPLDELVASSKTYVELRHGILGLILASYETTAALMGWTFYFLARHPDSYAKLREQILKAFGSIAEPHQDITFQTLKSCTYLQYVMKEALRLEPPVPRSIKTAARDTTLPTGGGPDGTLPIFIPKGTAVVYHARVMHRDTAYWGEDANEWRPERWETAKPSSAYMPFNAGPRICPGQQMGLTSAAYTIMSIAREYERIEAVDEEDEVRISVGLVCFKIGGVNVRLYPAGEK